jgi:site-specific DNA-adenine methylase
VWARHLEPTKRWTLIVLLRRYEAAARRLAALESQKEVAKVTRSLKSEAAVLAHECEAEGKRVQSLYEQREQELRVEMAQAVQNARQKAEEVCSNPVWAQHVVC